MSSPNILFLMTDQMQGRVLEPDNPCQTPNLDRLAARGMRFRPRLHANAVCSPARASLMTGLLPHNHGVLFVEHTVDADQAVLRSQHPHWAERLTDAGYNTGYFGKWHVEAFQRTLPFRLAAARRALRTPGLERRQFLARALPGQPARLSSQPLLRRL